MINIYHHKLDEGYPILLGIGGFRYNHTNCYNKRRKNGFYLYVILYNHGFFFNYERTIV